MISTDLFQDADTPSFQSFIGGMINDWLDQSSMRTDVACCPERTVGAVLEQYERAIGGEGWLIVAKDETSREIVGTLVLDQGPRWLRYAEGHLLNIHPDYRRAGCGRRLIGHAMGVLRWNRIRKLVLKTWDGNAPALAAFAAAGGLTAAGEPGEPVTTESWLPTVLSTLDSPEVDRSVRAGDFHATATPDDGLIRIGLNIGGRQRDFAVIPS
jgi:GNAT superfamily N-acetyltransferase